MMQCYTYRMHIVTKIIRSRSTINGLVNSTKVRAMNFNEPQRYERVRYASINNSTADPDSVASLCSF